jgi:hypothetical protein
MALLLYTTYYRRDERFVSTIYAYKSSFRRIISSHLPGSIEFCKRLKCRCSIEAMIIILVKMSRQDAKMSELDLHGRTGYGHSGVCC